MPSRPHEIPYSRVLEFCKRQPGKILQRCMSKTCVYVSECVNTLYVYKNVCGWWVGVSRRQQPWASLIFFFFFFMLFNACTYFFSLAWLSYFEMWISPLLFFFFCVSYIFYDADAALGTLILCPSISIGSHCCCWAYYNPTFTWCCDLKGDISPRALAFRILFLFIFSVVGEEGGGVGHPSLGICQGWLHTDRDTLWCHTRNL